MKNDEKLTVQEIEVNEITCKMFLETKFYDQLNDEGKDLFESSPKGFCATFTAILEDGVTLGNCVMSFCEVAYIGLNQKYQVSDSTFVKCELYKNGTSDTTFSVLVTIVYPTHQEVHHELLIFAQRELTDSLYSFELVGDQTMFAM
jgi:hypothetical protein